MVQNQQRCRGKDREKQGSENQSWRELGAAVKGVVPADVVNKSTDESQDSNAAPGLCNREREKSDIEQRQIRKQNDFVVLTRGKQRRSSKATAMAKMAMTSAFCATASAPVEE